MKAIELFKLQTGRYLETLVDVQKHFPDDGMVSVDDPSAVFRKVGCGFYYARISETGYELRGVGPDGRSFTEDELLPDLGSGARGQIGLVTSASRR